MNRKLIILSYLLIAGLAFSGSAFIIATVVNFNAVFDTDAADHANAALELYRACVNFNFAEIYQALVRQSFYPPVHSIFTLPVFLIFKPGYFSAILPSVLGYAFSALMLMHCVNLYYQKRFSGWQGFFILIMPSLLLLSSPINFFTAGLCMLEGVSLALFSLLLYLAVKFEEQRSNFLLLILTLILAALALTKYTLLVTVLPATALAMFIAWRQRLISLRQFLLPALVLAALLLTWFSIIDFKSVTDFIFNQPALKSGFWSYKNFFFYAEAFLNSHVVSPILGLMVFALVLTALNKERKVFLFRFMTMLIGFSLLAFTISSEKGSRHILFLMPAVFFLIPSGIASFKSVLFRRVILLTAYCLLFFGIYQNLSQSEKYFARKIEAPEQSGKLYDFIAENLPNGSSVLIEGLDDSLSLEGLRWHLAIRHNKKYSQVSADAFPFLAITKNLALSHQRLIAKPYKDTSIPKKPLLAVLQSSVYDYYVQVKTSRYFGMQSKLRNPDQLSELNSYLTQQPATIRKASEGLPEVVVYKMN